MDLSSASPSPLPLKSKNVSAMKSQDQVECAVIYLYTLISFSFLLIIHSFTNPKSTIDSTQIVTSLRSKALNPLTFNPLKDLNVPPYTNPNKTWFMATLISRPKYGFPEHFIFPSKPPNDKVLCINQFNKSYALATSNNSFPKGGVIVRGLTFLGDSFYDYENPWHGLNAISPFFAWMRERGGCEKPKRFVLFRNGKVVKKTGKWVYELTRAMLDGEKAVIIDGIEEFKDRNLVCFEKLLVMRRGLGGMEGKKRRRLFEMARCKAWKFCGLEEEEKEERELKISLVVREGKREFKNVSRVREVMERECRRTMKGGSRACRLQTIHLGNMSFCDQVRTMRNTDILTSTHGGQLTNMMFMRKGSSVMEMFPTGWLEGAGTGQFIYKWFADWSGMNYEGAWRDPNGLSCSELLQNSSSCFTLQKNQKVGVDEAYLASWTQKVIAKVFQRKLRRNLKIFDGKCPCN